jgi:hypothetical protein
MGGVGVGSCIWQDWGQMPTSPPTSTLRRILNFYDQSTQKNTSTLLSQQEVVPKTYEEHVILGKVRVGKDEGVIS